MTITTTQKLIKIGSSRGVILPAKQLKQLNVADNEEVEVIVRKKSDTASSAEVMQAADEIMQRYNQAFKNLADR